MSAIDKLSYELKALNIEQKKGLKRNSTDKFYTKKSAVEKCISLVKEFIHIEDIDLIIEPSAGNGAFIPCIKNISNNHKFYDLYPEHESIIKQDFLLLDHQKLITPYKKIHIIGNPPFGRQSSTAIKFIKKCCSFADSISFILPKSFKKSSMQKYIPLNYHLIHQCDLEKNSFLLNGNDCDVNCVFQIWQRLSINRPIIETPIPCGFSFVKKTSNPDISFRRVGANAGLISREIKSKNIQSHYFMKIDNIDLIKKLQLIKFTTDNTVGPKSISKHEIIIEFNKLMEQTN